MIDCPQHEWDDDCICIKCGVDGAEMWHLDADRLARLVEREET